MSGMGIRAATALGITACLAACMSRTDVWIDDELADPSTWGGYSATLDVPPCPRDYVLTVNTVAEELDGGSTITDPADAGERLSFAEAMWISSNRNVDNTILFDAAVFPAHAPGVIELSEAVPLPSVASDISVCIDGRNRGVVLHWPDGSFGCVGRCHWTFGPGSLVVGLTLLWPPAGDYYDGVVAGCRMGTDGYQTFLGPVDFTWYTSYVNGGTFGPGNVVSAATASGLGLSVQGRGVLVIGNNFGYDPLTRVSLRPVSRISIRASADGEPHVFAGNTFTGTPTVLSNSISGRPLLDVRGNFIGVDEHGRALPAFADGSLPSGIAFDGPMTVTLGPGNIIRGVEAGVLLGDTATVRITQNVISGNQVGIAPYGSGTLLPAPDVTQTRSNGVGGTCAGAGDVEVFSDPGDQGETYLGAAPCAAAPPYGFSLAVTVPAGRFVTAIYTDTSGQSSGFSTPRPVPYDAP